MITHRQRLWALGLTALLSIVGVIGLTVVEHTETQVFSLLVGTFTVAIAGWWDAIRVERRRRNPDVPALKDDIISDEAVTLPTSCLCDGCPRCLPPGDHDHAVEECRRTAELGHPYCEPCKRSRAASGLR